MFERGSNAKDGFQPMEVDLAAFEDEMDEEATYSSGGSGGKKKSACRQYCLCCLCMALLLVIGAVPLYYYGLLNSPSENNNNNNNLDDGPSPSVQDPTRNPTRAPTIPQGATPEAPPTNPPAAAENKSPAPTTLFATPVSTSTTAPTATTSDGSNNDSGGGDDSSSSSSIPIPPLAHREEDRVVYLGAAPDDWNVNVPRQADDSDYALMDPPIGIPDPYGWLRRDDTNTNEIPAEIIEYLKKENNYTQQMTASLDQQQDTIAKEMIGFLQETYFTLPQIFFQDGFYYYRRTIQDKPYALHCRAPAVAAEGFVPSNEYLQHYIQEWDGSADTPILPQEQVWLDENEFATQGQLDHLDVGDIAVSGDGTWVAYTIDDTGNELYYLIIEEIETHEVILWGGHGNDYNEISPTVIFGQERTTLFLVKSDEAQRDSQVYLCTITLLEEGRMGSNSMDCTMIFEEPNVEYWVSIRKTLDQKYLLVETSSSDTADILYLDLTTISDGTTPIVDTDDAMTLVAHRIPKVLYEIDHGNGVWWMLSNLKNKEFDLYSSTVGSHDWDSVITTDPDLSTHILHGHSLTTISVLDNYVIIEGRQQPTGTPQIWIAKINKDEPTQIENTWALLQDDTMAHTVEFVGTDNGSFHATSIIVEYQSLISPTQYIVVDLVELEANGGGLIIPTSAAAGDDDSTNNILLMQEPINGYDKSLYGCARILVPSRPDQKTGKVAQIPVSLVYLTTTIQQAQQEPVPMHLYAYGAYGSSIEDMFVSSRLPLLNRGMIYAIAHVRGGGELGRHWYDDGKLLNKTHTFDDFVDVARYFIESKKWTTADLLSIEGRSAGGLTMGASINQAPELFRAAILGVPFVDVLATMSDASIPLTALEWLEWGNPNEEEFFEYMKSYSPTNNVDGNQRYPSMLILAGLYDPRVAYWEPAKLTATLRYEQMTSEQGYDQKERPILLKTDMTSGHFSASDRYKYYTAKAFDYAFVLDQLGIHN